MVRRLWMDLGQGARARLAVGVVAVVALTAAAGAWLLRTDYDVLFAGLAPADAAVMTAELDRMKLPYALGADGSTILVDRASVHQTRLKLLGKDIPLRGAVGFELFNDSDFGMTEFAQKINYQRALQGEITRTILALAEVESARVHLALPEEGLFRRGQTRAKASVTLGLRRQQSLQAEQVNGIQRLIAAAVPGVSVQDVTIVDSRGVALTRAASSEPLAGGSERLDLKRDIERHLARKADDVLERAFGTGRTLTSVDVTLNLDQVRVTTEDVTTPAPRKGGQPAGVVIRERETVREDGTPLVARRDATVAAAGSSHRETEYQVGRRVEQVVSQPGSIARLQVVAVVHAALTSAQVDRLRALVGAAVGIDAQRGDVVVVQSLESLVGPAPAPAPMPLAEAHDAGDGRVAARVPQAPAEAKPLPTSGAVVSVLAVLLAAVAAGTLVVQQRRGGRRERAAAVAPLGLTASEREQALLSVQRWLQEPAHGR